MAAPEERPGYIPTTCNCAMVVKDLHVEVAVSHMRPATLRLVSKAHHLRVARASLASSVLDQQCKFTTDCDIVTCSSLSMMSQSSRARRAWAKPSDSSPVFVLRGARVASPAVEDLEQEVMTMTLGHGIRTGSLVSSHGVYSAVTGRTWIDGSTVLRKTSARVLVKVRGILTGPYEVLGVGSSTSGLVTSLVCKLGRRQLTKVNIQDPTVMTLQTTYSRVELGSKVADADDRVTRVKAMPAHERVGEALAQLSQLGNEVGRMLQGICDSSLKSMNDVSDLRCELAKLDGQLTEVSKQTKLCETSDIDIDGVKKGLSDRKLQLEASRARLQNSLDDLGGPTMAAPARPPQRATKRTAVEVRLLINGMLTNSVRRQADGKFATYK